MHRIKQLTLLLIDLLLLYAGLYVAVFIRTWMWPGENFLNLLPSMSQLFFVAVVINFIVGLYDISRAKNSRSFYQKILIAAFIWTTTGVFYFYIKPNIAVAPKTILVLTAIAGYGSITLWRTIYNRYLSTVFWKTKVVFAGITPEVSELIAYLTAHPELGFLVLGVVTGANEQLPLELANLPHAASLAAVLQRRSFDVMVIAPHLATNPDLLKELYQQLFRQTNVLDLAQFYEQTFKRVPPFTFSESWFLTNLREQQKKIYDRFRILIDYLVAIVVGIFFIVTLPFITLAVKVSSPGPLFFRQKRVGRLGKTFTIYKYRTMKSLSQDGSAEVAGPQFAAVNDTRITAVGKLLRRARLDELPQFINILKGEMAIVGPRPERPEFVTELTNHMPFYALRHLIKPGLTGWAQIHHSYYGNIAENLRKLEYDLYYIKNRGLLLDLVILLRTLNIVGQMGGR